MSLSRKCGFGSFSILLALVVFLYGSVIFAGTLTVTNKSSRPVLYIIHTNVVGKVTFKRGNSSTSLGPEQLTSGQEFTLQPGESAVVVSKHNLAEVPSSEDGSATKSIARIILFKDLPRNKKEIITSILRQDANLLEFARGLYTLLGRVNHSRLSAPAREREEPILDAFTRLLVGDETCAAAAIDGRHLLIATNKDVHEEHEFVYSVNILGIESVADQVLIRLQLKVSFDGRQIADEQFISYRQLGLKSIPGEGEMRVLTPNIDTIMFVIPQPSHGAPNITIRGKLGEIEIPVGTISPDVFPIPTTFHETPIDIENLKRRAHAIIQYLAFIVHPNKQSLSKEKIEEGLRIGRARILEQSLAWEARMWYGCGEDLVRQVTEQIRVLREKQSQGKQLTKREQEQLDKQQAKLAEAQKNQEQINDLISRLNEDFLEFKKCEQIPKINHSEVKKWWDIVIKKMNVGSIPKPDCIRIDDINDKFIKFAWRYFGDIETLEALFIESFKNKDKLALLIADESPLKPSELITIIDEGGQDLHAEMRLLLYFLQKHELLPTYIATSKLACCHCNLFMKRLGIRNNGRHGKIYPWGAERLIEELLKGDKPLLRQILGETLYDSIDDTPITIAFPPDGELCTATKKEFAWLVLQMIGSLGDDKGNGCLEILGSPHIKLWNTEDDYPDEFLSAPILVPVEQDILQREFLEGISKRYIAAIRNVNRAVGDVLWGGDIELIEVANLLGLKIIVHQLVNNEVREQPAIGPEIGTPIHLWLANGHYENYNSVTREHTDDIPPDGHCLFHAVLRARRILANQIPYDFRSPEALQAVADLRNLVADNLRDIVEETTRRGQLDADPIRTRFAAVFAAGNDTELATAIAYLPLGRLRDEAMNYLLPPERIRISRSLEPSIHSFNYTLSYAPEKLKKNMMGFGGLLLAQLLSQQGIATGVTK